MEEILEGRKLWDGMFPQLFVANGFEASPKLALAVQSYLQWLGWLHVHVVLEAELCNISLNYRCLWETNSSIVQARISDLSKEGLFSGEYRVFSLCSPWLAWYCSN